MGDVDIEATSSELRGVQVIPEAYCRRCEEDEILQLYSATLMNLLKLKY
jgi:hypothetical protein